MIDFAEGYKPVESAGGGGRFNNRGVCAPSDDFDDLKWEIANLNKEEATELYLYLKEKGL